jgi:hypothetical protein
MRQGRVSWKLGRWRISGAKHTERRIKPTPRARKAQKRHEHAYGSSKGSSLQPIRCRRAWLRDRRPGGRTSAGYDRRESCLLSPNLKTGEGWGIYALWVRDATGIMRPFSSVKTRPRHSIRLTAKLAIQRKNQNRSCRGSSHSLRRTTGSRSPLTPTT